VAKASFWRQQINQIPKRSLIELNSSGTRQLFLHRFQGPGGALLLLTIIVAMLIWNWKLLLATSVGVGVMVLVYSMQYWNWQKHLSQLHQFFSGSNRQLTLAVTSGAIATVSTYMSAAIWMDSSSPWIATGAILQGLGTLATLVLLAWQIVSFYGNREVNKFEELLANLTEKDPMKRLIAVRHLTKLVSRNRLDTSHQRHVAECLHLLLHQEEEAVVRNAVFDSLQVLEFSEQIPTGTTPFSPPIVFKPTAKVSQKINNS